MLSLPLRCFSGHQCCIATNWPIAELLGLCSKGKSVLLHVALTYFLHCFLVLFFRKGLRHLHSSQNTFFLGGKSLWAFSITAAQVCRCAAVWRARWGLIVRGSTQAKNNAALIRRDASWGGAVNGVSQVASVSVKTSAHPWWLSLNYGRRSDSLARKARSAPWTPFCSTKIQCVLTSAWNPHVHPLMRRLASYGQNSHLLPFTVLS